MSFFTKAAVAPQPKTQNTRLVSLLLAALLVGITVAQLFTFEDFPAVLEAMWLPIPAALMPAVAAVIVTCEVFALPFLLGLKLSPAMRIASMVAGWLVVVIWAKLSLGNALTGYGGNSGLLGATVELPAGWWAVLFCVALGVLAAWTAWGMWPFASRKK